MLTQEQPTTSTLLALAFEDVVEVLRAKHGLLADDPAPEHRRARREVERQVRKAIYGWVRQAGREGSSHEGT